MSVMYLRFPGGKLKALTFSYDDGVETDKRLIEIFQKHGLKGTFNINSRLFAPEGTVYPKGTIHRRMSKSDSFATYKDSGMEVAIHGAEHLFWSESPKDVTTFDIVKDRELLEEMFGEIVRGGAYPFGDFNDETVEALKSAGIVYCRAVQPTKDFRIPQDWLRLRPTCHHDEPNLFALTDKFLAVKENGWHPYLFYVWGHSYEFDQKDNWDRIEAFAEKIAHHEDIWYATNIEIYDYVESYRRLRVSLDGKHIHNPSAHSVWISADGKIHEIPAGETVTL